MAHEYDKKEEELVYWDGKDQAIVANWVDVEGHQFEPPATKLIFEIVIKPNHGLAPDQGVVAEAEAKSSNVILDGEILGHICNVGVRSFLKRNN